MKNVIGFILLASIQSMAVVIPTAVNQERPVMAAQLQRIGDATEDSKTFRLVLNRPATSRLATSFTYYEGLANVRCTGRCLPTPRQFRVVSAVQDKCGGVEYEAVAELSANQTDEIPDMFGHLAPVLTVYDQSYDLCSGEPMARWNVALEEGALIRHFEGTPYALLTIQ